MNACIKNWAKSPAIRLIAPSAAGVLPILVVFSLWLLGHLDALLLFIGIVSCASLGLLTQLTSQRHFGSKRVCQPVQPLSANAPDLKSDLLEVHRNLAMGLQRLNQQPDALFHELAALKLCAVTEDVETLAEGKLVFLGTESWRTVYERILRTPGLNRYFSVAWLRNEDYWRDAPGQHGMQLNYDLVQLGVRIERTFILNDFFWPPAALLPAKAICRQIEEQYRRGIVVRLIRESQIEDEPELLCDFGIYGERATGQLGLDEQCRSIQFTLDFSPHGIQRFDEQWRRLLLFAVSFRELLDRAAGRG